MNARNEASKGSMSHMNFLVAPFCLLYIELGYIDEMKECQLGTAAADTLSSTQLHDTTSSTIQVDVPPEQHADTVTLKSAMLMISMYILETLYAKLVPCLMSVPGRTPADWTSWHRCIREEQSEEGSRPDRGGNTMKEIKNRSQYCDVLVV